MVETCSTAPIVKKWSEFEYPSVSDYYLDIEGLEEHYYMTLEKKKAIFLEKIEKRNAVKIPGKKPELFYFVTRYTVDNTKWQVSLFIREKGDLVPIQNHICEGLIEGANSVFTYIDMEIDWERWVAEE